ncbi:MAG: potassium transporter Trk, partial [Oscillospiraceae bacterium]|nr:potassium transporter Trk [Oscillospiraceae bacterium]
IMGRRIDKESVYKSLSITILTALVTIVAAVIIFYTNTGVSGIDAAYETVTAISTTGLGIGVSENSGVVSRIVLSIVMFIGRVGPVSFAISLSVNHDKRGKNEVYPEGKMMVG